MRPSRTVFLLSLISVFAFTLTSVGQPQYYNLNTGTVTNSFPFGVADGKAVNSLFLAGEFSQPTPLPAGQAITKVYFRTAAAGTPIYTDLLILMAQDTITALTSGTFYAGPYDTVYSHPSATLTSIVDGWMGIVLDRPFNYDPAKSLIIFVGQCGSTDSTIIISNSYLPGIRRTWSVGGCPFAPYGSGDGAIANFGVDVAPAPQYYNLNSGTFRNTYPFNIPGGLAVNWLFRAGELSKPTPLPAAKAITTVYFRTATAGTSTYTNLLILMAQDTITNLTSGTFYAGPYDTVYSHASATLTSTVNGWMAIALDHPFNYDPTKSLIIFVGQCGYTGSDIQVIFSLLTSIRRTWSVGGCPFTPYGSGDGAIANFGVDVAPVPQYYNLNTGTAKNGYPFDVPSGEAVNWLFLAGEFSKPTPLPAGQAITKVYFRTATAGTPIYTDLLILMAQDVITTLTSGTFYPGPYDTVYSHASATPTSTVEGWMGITLDRSFNYDPAKSLIIFVGQCGRAVSNVWVLTSSLTGIRRTVSQGGCPFAPEAAGDGVLANFGVDVVSVTSVQPTSHEVPVAYELVQNYPNPFNPTTTIRYELPAAAHVVLTIYDILGREVKTLVNEQKSPGTFQVVWNGENAFGNSVASGVYFYRLTATSSSNMATITNVKRMILLK